MSEKLTRFIPKRWERYVKGGRIRHNVFKPHKGGGTSTASIDDLKPLEIWKMADTYVAPTVGPIQYRADFPGSIAEKAGLYIHDDGAFPGHRHLERWPQVNGDEGKDEVLRIAKDLADEATLVARPE